MSPEFEQSSASAWRLSACTGERWRGFDALNARIDALNDRIGAVEQRLSRGGFRIAALQGDDAVFPESLLGAVTIFFRPPTIILSPTQTVVPQVTEGDNAGANQGEQSFPCIAKRFMAKKSRRAQHEQAGCANQ